jgi:hypothetical protein
MLTRWTSDEVLFLVLQLMLIGFAAFAKLTDARHARRAGRGGTTLQVGRSEQSMRLFYGTYAAITGVLIAVCLSVEMVKQHRVIWVILDTFLIAYICLFNMWFRNKLVGRVAALSKLEKR